MTFCVSRVRVAWHDVLHLFSSGMLSVIRYKEPVPKNESPQPSPDLATTRDNKVGR